MAQNWREETLEKNLKKTSRLVLSDKAAKKMYIMRVTCNYVDKFEYKIRVLAG